MKMKWNWGTKLLLFIILFLVSVFVRIYISSQRSLDLITPEYYPQGIDYQQVIQKKKNVKKYDNQPEITQNDTAILIRYRQLTQKLPSGQVLIYCPAEPENDTTCIFTQQIKQSISKRDLAHGYYILKFEWKDDTIPFYYEQDISIYKQ